MKTILRVLLLTILVLAYLLQLAYVKFQGGKLLFSQNLADSSLISGIDWREVREIRYYQSVLDRTDKAEPKNTTYTLVIITDTKVSRTVANQPTIDHLKEAIETFNKLVKKDQESPITIGLKEVKLQQVKFVPEWLYLALGAVVAFVPLGRRRKKI
jgi:hypothetical protein